MSVQIGPGYSLVIRKQSIDNISEFRELNLGEIRSEDDMLLVLGPFFETESVSSRLNELGLSYFNDYFDLAHSGGEVPEWCKITLSYNTDA